MKKKKPRIIKCLNCKKEIRTFKATKKFCSNDCRIRYWVTNHPRHIVCPKCGTRL